MRRSFIAIAVSLVIALLSAACANHAASEQARPNILFILVDDQSPLDLKVYNAASPLRTPNIDRLAREGMVMDGAYHMGSFTGAVCTPSRHMIMSGRSLWHLPISPKAMNRKLCPPSLEQNTIPAVFNRAGYDTMRTCKVGNSYEAANRLFAVRKDATKRGDTDESGSPWHAERVLEYLKDRESRNDKDPFLIYFGFSHPHDTRDAPQDLLNQYGAVNHADRSQLPPENDKAPPLPIGYLEKHPFPHGHPGLRDEVDVSGVWDRRDPQTIRNELGREYACSENIDRQVGRVLQRLEEMGELENTWIFYTADHGMAIGRHGLQGKQNLYQHTWRVPMIVKGPGVKASSRAVGNIYLMDVLATICDIADVPSPASNEGLSFLPVLNGDRDTIRDVMYGVYCGGTKPGMRCVLRGEWKLVQYDVLDGAVRETQLFNLKANPHELLEQHHDESIVRASGYRPSADEIDLAGDPRFAKELDQMKSLLLDQMQLHDDPWRLWDQPK